MPRPGPRRPPVVVRLSPTGIAEVDELAAKVGMNRSEMIRTLLAEALLARYEAPRLSARDDVHKPCSYREELAT